MSPRAYRQSARATATAATRHRIVDGMVALAHERLTIEITLDDVARRAGVSVATVLRHFGSRDGLFDAAVRDTVAAVEAERRTSGPESDPVAVVVGHYEVRGDFMRRMLAQEDSDVRIRAFTVPGRLLHRSWVEEAFADPLATAIDRDELVDLLVVATDLQTWALLRRDRGLSRAMTESRMRRLVAAAVATQRAGR